MTHTPNLCDSHECLIDVADKANNNLLLVREKRVGGVIYDVTAESLSNFISATVSSNSNFATRINIM